MPKSKKAARAETVPRVKPGSSVGNPAHEEATSVLKCALIGPKGSGKTAFVASLGRAGIFSSLDEFGCVPIGPASWLTDDALDSFRHGRTLVNPSSSDKSYAFTVSDLAARRRGSPYRRLALRDLSSRSLFLNAARSHESKPSRRFNFEAVRKAQALILFFDSLDPRRADWQIAIVRILDELNATYSVPLEDREGPRLPQKRILILLSRVDLLCSNILRRSMGQANLFLRGLSPGQLAQCLDPLAQAVERLGLNILRALLSALSVEGELAVSLTSAGGFDQVTGLPVLNASGSAIRHSKAGDEVPSLDQWCPFGLLESIKWLITGRTSSAVEPVSAAALREISNEIAAASRRDSRGTFA